MSDEKARPLREHDLADTYQVADTASAAVTDFLLTSWPRTIAVHNVEHEPAYQKLDIDLLWAILDAQEKLRLIPVEVKGDRYDRTGNFFFETVSNADRGTPGCFPLHQGRMAALLLRPHRPALLSTHGPGTPLVPGPSG